MSFSKFTLNKVRNLVNYGLYVSGNTTDPIFSKGWLKTKPNILIKGSSCYIDYSHTFDVSDLTYLKQTFNKLGVGNTFYMNPTEYYDPDKKISKNLGGTFYISQFLNGGRIIIADIVSGISGGPAYDYFTKENFLSVPQFNFSTTASFTGYFLVNSLPSLSKNTFESIGILGNHFGYEEYISMSAGICENSDRILVLGSSTFKDGQEILYFLSGGTFQDIGNTRCSVDLYLRGNPELLKAPVNTSVTGIYTVSSLLSNSILYCFENQTLNQATLRKESLEPSTFSGEFLSCESCMDLVYGEANTMTFTTVGNIFDSLIFLSIVNGSIANVSSALTGSFVINSTSVIRVSLSTNKTLKIDLSHPSLIDYDLTIYTDPTRQTLISGTSFNKYGILGYNNSYAMIQNYNTNTILYCTLQGPSTIYFQIKL